MKFSLSELEVLRSIQTRKRLPERGISAGRHRRHSKAIEKLKAQLIIYKDEHDILQIDPGAFFEVNKAVKEKFEPKS